MRRIDRLFLILVLSLSAMQSTAVAWDNKKTHPDISERAALKSVIAGKDYLDRIGLSTTAAIPLEEVVAGKKILAWIRDGAEYEDAGTIPDALAHTARYLNHFHNPLRTNAQWPTAGLDDSTLNYHVWGMSLIEWAQSPTVQSSYLEGDHSWKAARDNYFLALTSPLDNTRREYFAKVFRDLGFQMHLVQDASVPDHVRNDNHGLESISGYSFKGGTFIEGWAANNQGIVNSAASSPMKPSVSFDVSYGGRAPITQLVDTDNYTGSNPSASTSLSWGLAEYANTNFFSDDTMFAADDLSPGDPHYFPYPKKLSTNYQAFLDKWIDPQTSIAKDGFIEACPYIEKKDDGEVVSHLLRPSYHTQDVQGLSVVIFDRTFYRDDECKDEYIRHLVPRAAGYSTALIDFFFRAKMDLFPSYSINSGHVITITAHI